MKGRTLLHTVVHTAFVIAGVIGVGGVAYFSLPSMKSDASLPRAEMRIHEIPIAVEIAATAESREQGLSGRSSLKKGTGMLFMFRQAGRWGIWMKEMQFPIDIVWIDRTGKVVSVKKEVAPETYPETFMPDSDAWYVLELPAGETDHLLIAEGDRFTLPQLQ